MSSTPHCNALSPDDEPFPVAAPTHVLPSLHAVCSSCAALCCVALPTSVSVDFGADKPAGIPCRHLRGDDRCTIHPVLIERGWRGCVAFDCFGAGPQATRGAGGLSWRGHLATPGTAELFAAFGTLRWLHEAAYHLLTTLQTTGARLPTDRRQPLVGTLERVAAAIAQPNGVLADFNPGDLRAETAAHLAAAGEHLRRAQRAAGEWAGMSPPDVPPGADLIGRRLAGRDLRTLDLRGTLLIAADLSGADLSWTDLLGADLRDTDLRGTTISHALFVSPPQLAAARGDAATILPPSLARPSHWH